MNVLATPSLAYRAKAALTLARSGVWLIRTRGRPDGKALRILLYHRVADDGDPLAVTPQRFREQMGHLAREGFWVVDLASAIAMLDDGRLEPKTIALTFDDAFADRASSLGGRSRA